MPFDSLIIGMLGSISTFLVATLMKCLRIDDPVGAVPVHMGAGVVGALAVGLFTVNEPYANDTLNSLTRNQLGFFKV